MIVTHTPRDLTIFSSRRRRYLSTTYSGFPGEIVPLFQGRLLPSFHCRLHGWMADAHHPFACGSWRGGGRSMVADLPTTAFRKFYDYGGGDCFVAALLAITYRRPYYHCEPSKAAGSRTICEMRCYS